MNFEHSLLKMVTKQKSWSTTTASGWPQGHSLVVQVSGGTLARISGVNPPNQDQIEFCGIKGRHNFWSRAWRPALFSFVAFRAKWLPVRVRKTRQNKSQNPTLESKWLETDGLARAVSNPILLSFELAASRCDDLTPLVYQRLHRERPETRAMFRSEGSDLVKGSMLAMTIESIIDFAGERSGKFRMIECEISSHDAYGTPRELFVAFFGVIAATLEELLGAEWSAEIDQAWRKLIVEIEGLIAQTADT
jgi:hemoglobin-like flavoprotein